MRYLVIAALVLLTSCTNTSTRTATVEHRTGIEHGTQTDLVIKTRSVEDATTTVDIAPMVGAAVKAAMGDYGTALKQLTERPAPPSVQDLMSALEKEDGLSPEAMGFGGAASGLLLLALREYLAHKKTAKDNDEAWERLATKETKDTNAHTVPKS